MSDDEISPRKSVQTCMAESLHKPLLLLPTPNSKTRILGVRYSDCVDEYLDYSDDNDNYSSLPINNGLEEVGKCKVIDFESDLFVGSLLLRIKGAHNDNDDKSKSNSKAANGSTRSYFGNRKRTFQGIVRGRFKRSDIAMQHCVTGQVFQREPGNLPPKFVLNTAINFMKTLAPQLYIEFGERPRFLSPLCATAQRIVVFVESGNNHNLKPKSDYFNNKHKSGEDEGFWMGIIRCISGQQFRKDGNSSKESKEESRYNNTSDSFEDPFSLSGKQKPQCDSSKRTTSTGFVDKIVRGVSSLFNEDTSQIEFTNIPEEDQIQSGDISNNSTDITVKLDPKVKTAVKTVQRLSSIFGDCAALDDSLSNKSISTNSNISSKSISQSRPNLEIDIEEPEDERSILCQIPNQTPSKSKSENSRLKHRKKVFNDMFAKRESSKHTGANFSDDREYSFEFYQHLLLFDDFSMKLPFHRPKLAGCLNGQPLQFMAAHQKDTKSMRDLNYLWSFDIWHSSLLEKMKS